MTRLLGIDYGKKRIGIAVSDPLGMFASGLTTLDNRSDKQVMAELGELIRQYDVERIVLGFPRRTTGEPGDTAEEVTVFGTRVEETFHLPVTYEDERFTSVIAQQSLREQGIQPSRKKHLIDQTSAALILQHYLDKSSRR